MPVQSQNPKKTTALPWPALVPMGHHAGKPPISLAKMVILVGSRHNAHLHLLSRHVSKAHALVLSHDGSVYIRDLASREGVYVNGVQKREAWLKDGDLLKIGTFTFKYKDGPTRGAGAKGDKAPAPADLEVEGADEPLSVAEKVMLIGRRPTCDVSLVEASVSTAHAVIFHVGGKRYIRDLGSRTGTFVDGVKVHQHELTTGDEIKIGDTLMRYTPAMHEHAIAPASVGREEPAGEADELDHLVATAEIDVAAEIAREQEEQEAARTTTGVAAAAMPKVGPESEPVLELEPVADAEVGIAPEAEPVLELTPVEDMPETADPAMELARALGPPAGRPVRPEQPVLPSPLAPVPPQQPGGPTRPMRPEHPTLPVQEQEEDEFPLELEPESELVPLDLDFEPETPAVPGSGRPERPESPTTGWRGASSQAAHPAPVSGPESEAPVDPETAATVAAATGDAESSVTNQEAVLAGAEGAEGGAEPVEPIEVAPPVEVGEPVGEDTPGLELEPLEAHSQAEGAAAVEPVSETSTSSSTGAASVELDIEAALGESPPAVGTSQTGDEAGPLSEAASVALEKQGVEVTWTPDVVPVVDEGAASTTVERPVEDLPVVEEARAGEGTPVVEAEPNPAADAPVIEQAPSVAAAAPVTEEAPAEKRGRRGRGAEVDEAKPKKKRGRKSKKEREAEQAAEAAAISETSSEPISPTAAAPGAAEAIALGAGVAAAGRAVDAIAQQGGGEPERVSQTVVPTDLMPTTDVAPPHVGPSDVASPVDEASVVPDIPVAAETPAGGVSEEELLRELSPDSGSAVESAPIDVAPVEIAAIENLPPEPELPAVSQTATTDGAEIAATAPFDVVQQEPPPSIADEASPAVTAEEILAEEYDEAFEGSRVPADDVTPPTAVSREIPAAPAEAVAEVQSEPATGPAPSHGEVVEAAPDQDVEQLDDVQVVDDELPSQPETRPASDEVDEALPVLDLESAELAPVERRGDPDELLALDQVDADDLEALEPVEVVDATEPGLESALDVRSLDDGRGGEPVVADAAGPALSDTAFARQVDDFTGTSTGELVEERGGARAGAGAAAAAAAGVAGAAEFDDLPEIELASDEPLAGENLEEELAVALGAEQSETTGQGATEALAGGGGPEVIGAISNSADFAGDSTSGSRGTLESQEFVATVGPEAFDATDAVADAVTPPAAAADPALGATIDSQSFVTETGESDVAAVTQESPPTPALDEQAFVAEGEAQPLGQEEEPGAGAEATIEGQTFAAPLAAAAGAAASAPVTPTVPNIPPQGQHAQPRVMPEAPPVVAGERPTGAQVAGPRPTVGPVAGFGGLGGGGGFVIGSDLSSFIGGMPLNLPDLTPPPPSFGRVEVSFAGAKAPWQALQRPGLPMGGGLAGEVLAAAQGLRDVEQMDETDAVRANPNEADAEAADSAFSAEAEESFHDEGAPADEWNVVEALDFDEEEDQGIEAGAAAAPPAPAGADATNEPTTEGELEELAEFDAVAEAGDAEVGAPELAELSELEALEADAVYSEDVAAEAGGSTVTEEAPAEGETAGEAAGELEELSEADFVTDDVEELVEEQPPEAEATTGETEELAQTEAAAEAQPDPWDTIGQNEDTTSADGGDGAVAVAEDEPATVDELIFEDPEPEVGGARLGAMDEAVEELRLDGDEGSGPVVDRSPPPPVAPPSGRSGRGAAIATGAVAGAAAAGMNYGGPQAPPPGQQAHRGKGPQMVVPPPPARGPIGRGRRGAESPSAGAGAGGADAGTGAVSGGFGDVPVQTGGVRQMDVFAQTALGPADPSVFDEELNRPAGRKGKPAPAGKGGRGVKGGPDVPELDLDAALTGSREGRGGAGAPGAAPPRQRPGRTIVPPRMGDAGGGGGGGGGGAGVIPAPAHGNEGAFGVPPAGSALPFGAAPGGAGGASQAYPAPAARKHVGRTVFIVVVLMIIAMAGAALGIFYWVKPKLTTEGRLRFKNLGSQTKRERDELLDRQRRLLWEQPNVLVMARHQLQNQGVPLGFLEPAEFVRLKSGMRDELESDALVLRFKGNDRQHDPVRINAILMALYQENGQRKDEEIRVNAEIKEIEKEIARLDELMTKHAALKERVTAPLSAEKMAELKRKSEAAEAQWKEASASLERARLEVERAQKAIPPVAGGTGGGTRAGNGTTAGGGIGTGPAPEERSAADAADAATAAAGVAAAGDAEVARLQRELEQAASKLAAAKGVASEEADAKRKALDNAVEAFEQMTASMARENPELAQYIESAKGLQDRLQRISNKLLNVQQEHYASLTDYQKQMNALMESSRNEIWAKDEALSKLRSEMDFKQRSYNAVVAEGSDAAMVKKALADIQELQAKIDNRKRELAEHPVITKYTEGLQNLIQISKTRLEAERAEREKEVKEAEQAFAKEETAHKLSAAQRAQAERLKKQQQAINELRNEYAASLEKKSAESNQSLKDLEGRLADLRSKIDERQRYLAAEGSKQLTKEQEAARQAALAQKQSALKAADEQARQAWDFFYHVQTQLKVEEARQAEAEKLRPELEAIATDAVSAPESRRNLVNRLEVRRDELKMLVTLVEPSKSDQARVVQDKDDRWLYVAGSWLGIALVFGIAAVVVSASGGGERRAGQYHPLDAEPIDREQEVPVA